VLPLRQRRLGFGHCHLCTDTTTRQPWLEKARCGDGLLTRQCDNVLPRQCVRALGILPRSRTLARSLPLSPTLSLLSLSLSHTFCHFPLSLSRSLTLPSLSRGRRSLPLPSKKATRYLPGTYLTKVFLKSFCKSQFPHKFVNYFFTLVIVKDRFADLWGS